MNRIDTYAFSEIGNRKNNEDSVAVEHKNNLVILVVCDGLGGQGAGEIASQTAVEAVKRVFLNNPKLSQGLLEQCFQQAHFAVKEKQHEKHQYASMMTTMAILLTDGSEAVWGHVGDTRLYFFRDSKIFYQTKDHSVCQALVNAGQLKTKQMRYHEDRSRMLRAIGDERDECRYELCGEKIVLQEDDTFLLCTDGVWEHITEREMVRVIRKENSAYKILQKISKSVLKKGTKKTKKDMDNYTAGIIKICPQND